jgi:hypothetical protein
MGGYNEEAWIYRMKRNEPIYVGSVKWCTAGYYGEEHEVMHELARAWQVPARFDEEYYRDSNKNFTIRKVGG